MKKIVLVIWHMKRDWIHDLEAKDARNSGSDTVQALI